MGFILPLGAGRWRGTLDDIPHKLQQWPGWEITYWVGLREPKNIPPLVIPLKMKERLPQVFVFPAFILCSLTGASFLGLSKYLQGKGTRCLLKKNYLA